MSKSTDIYKLNFVNFAVMYSMYEKKPEMGRNIPNCRPPHVGCERIDRAHILRACRGMAQEKNQIQGNQVDARAPQQKSEDIHNGKRALVMYHV
jgi:hypothetical protein